MRKNMDTSCDKYLIASFQKGNNQALSDLIHKYKERIFSSILYLVKDSVLAEDIFQDTFIKVIETLRSKNYNDEGKFLPWAMRISHNLCIDHFRRQSRKPVVLMNDAYDQQDIFEALGLKTEDNAEQRMIKEQSYANVHRMLELLPQEQKEVVVLRHFADLSFKEIAVMTDCSINTALGRMRYGLMNLRKIATEYNVAL